VAWAPNGRRILTCDSELRIWESRLEDALPIWRTEYNRERVRLLVDSLFYKPYPLEPLLVGLKALPDDLRSVALRMADARGDPMERSLSEQAWNLIDPVRDDRNSDVARALRLAWVATEFASEDQNNHRVLAWALYANGHYAEAIAKSLLALELAGQSDKGEYQADLDRLGKAIDEAQATDTSNGGGADGEG
jgi:hypothetical protein